MGYQLNIFTGQLDLTGSGGATSWRGAVATEAGLSTSGNTAGDAVVTLDTDYIWVWDDSTSRWINTGIKSANVGSTPSAAGYSLEYTNVSTNRRELQLILQPADGTNPGVLSTGAQTIAGNKTFSGTIGASNLSGTNTGDVTLGAVGSSPNSNGASLSGQALTLQPADGTNPGLITSGTQSLGGVKTFNARVNVDSGLDVSSAGTLSIGANTATTINIGKSGTTVNIIGSTTYEQVTDLQVSDKLITINKGGAAGSASATGLEIEENSVITGYIKTSADRNSYKLLAPNTAGVVTVTPGAGGFTINQGSHDAVTLASVGASPNSSGASLSGQQLTLQPADGTNPGVVTTAAQTIAGAKTFSTAPILSSLTASLPLKLDASNNVTSAAIDLSGSEVTSTLPVSKGGTNSATALNSNRIMVSSGGAIVEAAALTDGQLLIGNTGNAPTAAALTQGSGITITNGAGSITVAMSVPSSSGDIAETSFSALASQTDATLTGLAFANGSVRGFKALLTVTTATQYEVFELMGIQRAADWQLSYDSAGDISGYSFAINNSGQILYTSGAETATIKFRASVLGV